MFIVESSGISILLKEHPSDVSSKLGVTQVVWWGDAGVCGGGAVAGAVVVVTAPVEAVEAVVVAAVVRVVSGGERG